MAINKKKRVALVNASSCLLLQLVTIISGFIIPRLILVYFGSEVNGLVSSLTKFLSYINILEGGLTGVVIASLYRPFVSGDNKKISSIVKTASNFYKKISIIFLLFSIMLAIFYPILVNSSFSAEYIFWLTIILSSSSFVQYCFTLSSRTILSADKKVYIVSLTQSLFIVLSVIASYFSLVLYPDIHLFKAIPAAIFIIQPLIFNTYVGRKYQINKKAKIDKGLLKQRWDGFALNIADFIHTNTDIVILTVFASLSDVSIYSVYALVISGLRSIMQSLSNGIRPSIGQLYAKGDICELQKKISIYEHMIFFIVFTLFSVTAFLIIPFVGLYTSGINDANYYQPAFAIIIVITEGIGLIRNAHLDLAYSANKFKEMKIPCFIEAGINIAISMLLIGQFGLIGIAIGTMVSTIFRTIYHVWFAKKLINRPQRAFYLKLLSFGIFGAIGIVICLIMIPFSSTSLIDIIVHSIVYLGIFGLLYFVNSVLFYKNELKGIAEYIKK